MSKNVIIVGMARSGTSLTAGVFARKGYYVGSIARERLRIGDHNNPFGYFEADILIDQNVELFRSAGYSCHNTWLFDPIPERSVRRLSELRWSRQHRDLVDLFEANTPWMWKDPRLCFALRYWWRYMDPSRTHVLLVQREPKDIYWSFVRRGWCGTRTNDRELLFQRVEQHYASALETIESLKIPYVAVNYSEYMDHPEQVASRLGAFFDLELAVQDLNVRTNLNHSHLRGKSSSLLRSQLMKLAPGIRSRIKGALPSFLLNIVLPESRFVDKDHSKN